MKIAIAINTSWNIYNFRKGLVSQLLERGDEVVAIAPHDDYTHRLEELGCRFHHLEVSASGMNPVKDIRLFFRLRRILKRERPDVLLTYTIKPNIYGSLAAGSLGIPCICNVSGLGTVFLWKGYVRKIATSLYALAFRFSGWIFFQNTDDRQEFARFVGIDLAKTSILAGSGVNTRHFAPVLPPVNPVPVFLMVARLLVEKGVYDFIGAIRILKKKGKRAQYRLIGALDESHSRSIQRSELAQWIEEGLVIYEPHLEDIRQALTGVDAVVLPSYREGTPRTLLEAGAMGKPLIATDVAGCNNVVVDGHNGFLCKLKNPKDLAAKMALFLSLGTEEKAQLGMHSREIVVSRFDEQLVIDSYLHKIDDLTRVI